MTICQIQRNDAEARVKAMATRNWRAEGVKDSAPRTPAGLQGSTGSEEAADVANVNLEELAADRIERLIEARFKGHELALLVEAILQAEGYTTYRSPEGADGGADILAGGGELTGCFGGAGMHHYAASRRRLGYSHAVAQPV